MFHPVLFAALIESALALDKARFDIGEDAHRILQGALQHNDELYPEECAVLLSSFPPGALDQMKADLLILQDAANRLSGLLRDMDKVKSEVSNEDAILLGAFGSTAGVAPLQDTTSSQLVNLAIAVVLKYESRYTSAVKGFHDCLDASPSRHDSQRQASPYSLTSLFFVRGTIEKAIDEAEAQLTVLEQQSLSCAISLSIVRSIPSEILLHIFAFVHVDKPYFPRHVTHRRMHVPWDGRVVVGRVCRRWRELVNGHSVLWRDITFPPSYSAQASDLLLYQLSRVRYGHINATVPMYNRKSPLGKLFLSLAPRVARLKVENCFDTNFDFEDSWLFDLPRRLPLLQSVELVIHDTYELELLDRITAFTHAPLLQTFTSIISIGKYHARRPNHYIPLPYANLVEFNTAWYIDSKWQTSVSFPNFFLRPLYEGKRLKTYRQSGCGLKFTLNAEMVLRRRRQDSLVKLVTCSSMILDAIACPLLETLSVGNVEGDGTCQVPEHQYFPDRTPQSARSLIESTAAFLKASLCPLKSLELTSVTFNHNFIAIIQGIPCLETLNATATRFSAEEDDTLSEFFSLLRQDDHGTYPVLPQLRSLSFTVNLCENHPRWRRFGHNMFRFANTSLFEAIVARSNVMQEFSLIIKAGRPFWALEYERERRLRELECVKELRCENISRPRWLNRSV